MEGIMDQNNEIATHTRQLVLALVDIEDFSGAYHVCDAVRDHLTNEEHLEIIQYITESKDF
jgi:hypothetical protein